MIAWSLSNIFQFISFIAPSLIAFFLFMASVFNQDLKGFVYLAGALFAACINRIAQSIIGTPGDDFRPVACTFFDGLFPLSYLEQKFQHNRPQVACLSHLQQHISSCRCIIIT